MAQVRLTTGAVVQQQSLVQRWSRKLTLAALGLAMVTLGLLGSTPRPAGAATEVGHLRYLVRIDKVADWCSLSGCSWRDVPVYDVIPLHAGEIIEFRGTNKNDKTFAISLSSGAKAALYSASDLTGVCEVFTASDGDLGNNRIGRDTVSSVHVGADCNTPVARIYEHSNYTGASRVLGTSQQYNPATGWYEIRDLDAGNIDFNDAVTSIRLYPGQVLQVCQHANFGGNCAILGSSVSNMGTIGLVGNDTISSIRFYKP